LVIGLPVRLNGFRKTQEYRASHPLREGFLRHGTTDTTVAILEWVNGLEVKVRDGAADGRKTHRLASVWCLVEPIDEALHLDRHAGRRGRLVMDLLPADRSRDHLHRLLVGSPGSDTHAMILCEKHLVPRE